MSERGPVARVRGVPVVFAVGDVVRVRCEEALSVVVLPTDRPPDCAPDGVPEVAVCCVPIALVRTPDDDGGGVLRWVEIGDLTLEEPEETEESGAGPDGPAGVLVPD